jgi:enoyl-CoA hydratase/carnithine racemase
MDYPKPYETILLDVANHIATVTINRPEAMNSFTKRMMDECAHLWRAVAEDDDIHVVVLRAAPGRAFSTGVDVKAAQEEGGAVIHHNVFTAADPGEKLGPKMNQCWKPVIAAVHGLCAGGAFYWISECDIVIASEDAAFFDPHVSYGMTAALEPIGLTYRMPLGDVLRMALLGNDERISAYTALRLGLVSEVTKPEDLWARAQSLAETVASKPPIATQGTVKAIWESLDMPRTTALRTALKYCQIGNPIGTAQVDRWALMGMQKKYETR